MLVIPVIHQFIEDLHVASKESISNLDDAEAIYDRLKKSRIKAEGKLFNTLYSLSIKKQQRLLKHIVDAVKSHDKFYIQVPEWIARGEECSPSTAYFEYLAELIIEGEDVPSEFRLLSEKVNLEQVIVSSREADAITNRRYESYEYLYWLLEVHRHEDQSMYEEEDLKNAGNLSDIERSRLLKQIVSEAYSEYYENIRRYYSGIVEPSAANELILDLNIRKMILEPGNDVSGIDAINENKITKVDDIQERIVSNDVAGPLLKWKVEKGGVADMAELLYRLEKSGFIDLQEYVESGNVLELCRRICYVFDFGGKNPIGTLRSYLNDIKNSLGKGPVDIGALSLIGRKGGGKMSDIIPSQDSSIETP